MSAAQTMTVAQARDHLRVVGWTIRNTGWGDYRCGPKGCTDEAAYYTDSLADAVDTARADGGRRVECTIHHGEWCGHEDCVCADKIGAFVGGAS